MKWLANLQTSTKLSLSLGLIILILGLVIYEAIETIYTLSKTQENLYKTEFRLVENITRIDDDNNAIISALAMMYITPDNTEKEKLINKIKELTSNQSTLHNEAITLAKNDPVLYQFLTQYSDLSKEMSQIRNEQIIPASNTTSNANKQEGGQKILLMTFNNQVDKMNELIENMLSYAQQNVHNAVENSNKQLQNSIIFFIILGIIALVLSIIIVFVLKNLITSPLNELVIAAKKVANGDLRMLNLSSVNRKDEVGILGSTFNQMVQKLNTLTKEISGVINFLTTSSNEIASASSELSSTAAETATSISETTSTIEEVKQTSQVANKKAIMVSEASKKTTEISETGKKAAEEINVDISEIQKQMNLIAETMMRLSEHSQAVGAIITTVEDLAQQTNLLAVNASIEASKAGEQGKGFSVVAQEVKSLATQSKQATSQVRTILNDIQKATSAAVMATEMGSKAVETGVKKTGDTGNTILTLVKTVTDNAQAASQIAAVSHQQLVGMEQATVAMENIKKASSQNVESSRLLKDSVLTIKELGERLKNLISQFKIESE